MEEKMFERVFRALLLILAIVWIAPGVSSGQMTPELIDAPQHSVLHHSS
jgi:hypothetical protein